MTERAKRPAARLLLCDPDGRLLLFRFTPDDRPPFWCTPGGALDPGETYEQAARRELLEETGIDADPGAVVAERHVLFRTIEGVDVEADERYFVVRAQNDRVDPAGHTELEQRVMQSWRWWTVAELAAAVEPYFPEDLEMLWAEVGVAAGRAG